MNNFRPQFGAFAAPAFIVVLSMLLCSALARQQGGVAKSASDAIPLKVGASAPDSTLRTTDGKDVQLKDVLGGKPTVLIFYRGGWCPFCNRQLGDLQTIEGQLTDLGYQLVAISPDKPEELVKTMDKHKLSYSLFSDSKIEALKNFGVAFRVDDDTFSTYHDKYHIDLESASGETHHVLPVPSVFIIDAKGKIVFVHSNPDYKVRMSGAEVLAAAKAASK